MVMVVVELEEGEVEVERGEVGGVAESGSGDEEAMDEGWRHCHTKVKSINQITYKRIMESL